MSFRINKILYPSSSSILRTLKSNHATNYLNPKIQSAVAIRLGNKIISSDSLRSHIMKSISGLSKENASNAYTDLLFVLEDLKVKK